MSSKTHINSCIQVILNLYEDPRYKNQTSEKRYKVPTTALPPMRDFASLILGKYCTFVCGKTRVP
jgi:hypothetical protein